jgi:hypothetical protein
MVALAEEAVSTAKFEPIVEAPALMPVASNDSAPPMLTAVLPAPHPEASLSSPALAAMPPVPPTATSAPKALPDEPVLAPLKHIRRTLDEELRKQLVLARVVGFRDLNAGQQVFLTNAPKNKKYPPEEMPYFAGLPMRMGVDCQLGKEGAETLQVLSRKLRAALASAIPKDGSDPRPNPEILRQTLFSKHGYARQEWAQPEAVATLQQLLMAENKPIRLLLVELLAQIDDRTSTQALAQRALYDLTAEVREAAVEALRNRSADDYRSTLLKGLNYPWAPVANHAAEALVALQDRQAVPDLVSLLEEPDPEAPFIDSVSGEPVVRELVRINHQANCTLCHAQSIAVTDPVRGLVPSPNQPLPPPISPSQYYDGTVGSFIRADVTYLQQDFSVHQPVARPGPWPVNQRFDYLVRLRHLTKSEKSQMLLGSDPLDRAGVAVLFENNQRKEPCEQHRAVLFALRELTGKDRGFSASDWRRSLIKNELSALR